MTSRCLLVLFVMAAAADCRGAELVRERWSAKDVPATHPGTMRVEQGDKALRLVFDLSALHKALKIHRASLYCFTEANLQPTKAPEIYFAQRLQADGEPIAAGKPLALEPPWFRCFDATDALSRWAAGPEKELYFVVTQFERLLPSRTYLEVLHSSGETLMEIVPPRKPPQAPPQAEGLRVVHHDGQTFIVWKEHAEFRPKAEEVIWIECFDEKGDKIVDSSGPGAHGLPRHPAIRLKTLRQLQGLGLRDKPSGFQGIKPLQRVREVAPIEYRVYRHAQKITPSNLHEAEFVASVEPLSGFDQECYAIDFQGEYLDQREVGDSVIPTYCVEDGKAVLPGEALYVHTPKQPGKLYYAVTTALAGTENCSQLTAANSLEEPIEETPAAPQPVLQFIQTERYNTDVPEYWYRFWAAPPQYHLPSGSFRVAVAVPEKFRGPGPLIIGNISDAFNVRGYINVPPRDAVTLLIEEQVSWMPNLFYNEGRGTLRGMTECKVDYFSERYTCYLINWAMSKWKIERTRISGSMLHFGLRHPEIFARMSFGTYTADYDRRWCPGSGSLPGLLGPKGIKTVDGEDAWEMFSVGGYVNKYPQRDIPFLICISAVGKDSGHTSEFGWQDDPRGWHGLLSARQTFVASWSTDPPRELMEALPKMRWEASIPAFTNCSLNDNPGNGDPADGDYYGQINGWLLWSDTDQVDEPGRWEMTVYLISSCPENSCTVDVTPRHCRAFKPKPGDTLKWTNTSLKDNQVVQSGEVTADQCGLATVGKLIVTRGKNRIAIGK